MRTETELSGQKKKDEREGKERKRKKKRKKAVTKTQPRRHGDRGEEWGKREGERERRRPKKKEIWKKKEGEERRTEKNEKRHSTTIPSLNVLRWDVIEACSQRRNVKSKPSSLRSHVKIRFRKINCEVGQFAYRKAKGFRWTRKEKRRWKVLSKGR